MKIAVNGSIINTEDIYEVTSIKGDNCWGTEEEKKPLNQLFHSGYYFKIKFFNQKELTINIIGSQIYPSRSSVTHWWSCYNYDYKLYLQLLGTIHDKIERFREEIIGYWSVNQSKIPQINLFNKEDNEK